ncbi:ABC transporter ATP-binding protein [Candidatus Enterococcus ikei]|uniref:ABC transporter ATP-binding protein n=1 Tax=Candidatus Enterococcus ikei TaxID=2815326 RepID=A0ABS3GVV5_9ENTE|nr:ABC transporter ATP-binding protein [Enterococcus sp. DIV0869a]MBO0439396.1 ABC transporter ATP-binding protein [Enterococcus sp. DIV0869a]
MIELINVSFGYKRKEKVLSEINLKINQGECWGVLGHNGAGKTTLSYLIMKLLSPREGRIINNSDDYDYLPEFGGYYNHLTVLQNFEFKLSLSKSKTLVLLDDTLQKLGLWDIKNKLASRLSQGQKKRLAIGLIIISGKEFIYLDEPTNGLDPEMLIILKDYLVELMDKGKTIIINSHNIDFINDISTNVLILNRGKIVYKNTTAETVLETVYFDKVGVNSEKNVE